MSDRMSRLDEALGRYSAACVRLAATRPAWVLAVATALTVASLAYAATHLGINSDTSAMLSEDLGFRRVTKQIHAAFPQIDEPLIVVVDAPNPDEARTATALLAERLAARPDLFRAVFAPGVGSFFESRGLLYVDKGSLQQLADRLIAALPLVGQLSKEPTLPKLLGMVGASIDPDAKAGIDADKLPELYDGVAEVLDAPLAGTDAAFSWGSWVLGDEFGDESSRRVIVATPVLAFDELKAARRPIAAVRAIAEEIGLTPEAGFEVRITGDPALGADEMDTVVRQAGVVAVGVSILSVTLLLLIGLRSRRLVLVTVLTLFYGLAYTTGFAALAVGHLNLISIAFAVLFVGLAVDFGIHFALHYQELRAGGEDSDFALIDTGRDVGSSLTLCAATTTIGFYAFIPTRYAGVAELGLISGTGMFLALVCTLFVFPALLKLTGSRKPKPLFGGRVLLGSPIAEFPIRHARAVCVVGAIVALVTAAAAPFVRFDPDPVKVRDPTSESVEAMNDLLRDSPESPWTVELVVPSLTEADRIAAQLQKLPEVSRAVTLSSFVPDDQNDKLAILDDLAFFMEPIETKPAPREEASDAGVVVADLRKLRDQADAKLAESDLDERLRASLTKLRDASARMLATIESASDADQEVARIEQELLGELPTWVGQLSKVVTADRVRLEDLPASIRERFVADDGRARIEVFPAGDLSKRGALHHFVDTVQSVVPQSAGAAVEIVESGRAIVVALQQALSGAVVAVAILLIVLWRSLKDTLLVLAALLLASLMTAATTVAIDLPLNFADVIVLPLLLGIGVDSGIHLVQRHRTHGPSEHMLRTSTARAVFFSAATTIISFGTLAFSSHRGVASLGLLLAFGLVYMLVANLIFLPAFITWIDSRSAGGRPLAGFSKHGDPSEHVVARGSRQPA